MYPGGVEALHRQQLCRLGPIRRIACLEEDADAG